MSSPIIWSVAGTDSGGGAGLAADQRAADAFGVHLCTVVAGVTAQSTTEVTHIEATPPAVLQAQLDTLLADMPPRVIKTGLLASAENVRVLVRFVDALRARGPLALVVDPVLAASTGAALADAELRAAYRELLIPRATVITPNQGEAVALLEGRCAREDIPAHAAALKAMGAQAVVITGGDAARVTSHATLSLDWIDTPQARGWLYLPHEDIAHNHGTGCTFASSLAAALALGWCLADATVLAKMAATHALRHARVVGRGVGPVIARAGFGTDPTLLPHLSLTAAVPTGWERPRTPARMPGVYAIVDTPERAEAVLRVRPGVGTLQLRMKRPSGAADADWQAQLAEAIARSRAAAEAAGALLVVNDHWREALAAGAPAVHLGQEDLLALTPEALEALQAAREQRGLQLGVSSHSLWELARAAALAPDLIACGPVWPTTTKDMPWVPQGLDNLAWWAHMAPAPVVGIGGILAPAQLLAVAAAGAAGGCLVRGLGEDPAATLPAWLAAWERGRAGPRSPDVPPLPHPTLLDGT